MTAIIFGVAAMPENTGAGVIPPLSVHLAVPGDNLTPLLQMTLS